MDKEREDKILGWIFRKVHIEKRVLSDAEQLLLDQMAELHHLRHFRDTSVGLWCVDQGPDEVKKRGLKWYRKNAFRLNDNPKGCTGGVGECAG